MPGLGIPERIRDVPHAWRVVEIRLVSNRRIECDKRQEDHLEADHANAVQMVEHMRVLAVEVVHRREAGELDLHERLDLRVGVG